MEKNRPALCEQGQGPSTTAKESFVAHSCSHDMHMTSWLGTAQALLGLKKNQWKGTLMFVAQPSEKP